MHTIYSTLLACSTLGLSTALPHPMADRPQPPAPDRYYIDSQTIVAGTPFTGGVSVTAGGTVQIQEQYSVGYTIELGADLSLNIDDIIGAGVSFSVSKTTETAIAESASYTCPAGAWTCALQVLPSVVQVHGRVDHHDILTGGSTHDYQVTVPRTDSNGNAIVQVTLCACHNRLAWADPGAPPPCPQDCN